jgi:hypothetical protein
MDLTGLWFGGMCGLFLSVRLGGVFVSSVCRRGTPGARAPLLTLQPILATPQNTHDDAVADMPGAANGLAAAAAT